ncbi:MAG: hypothetical protein KKA28_19290 [Planctomycetes bacterium]|nr:hypothetical protein [Planctomycetota bacterium]
MKKIVLCCFLFFLVLSLRAENSRLSGIINLGVDKWYGDDFVLFYEFQLGIEYKISEKLLGEFYYIAMPNFRQPDPSEQFLRNSYAESWELLMGYVFKKWGNGAWLLKGELGAGYQRYAEWIRTPPLIEPVICGPKSEDYFYPLLKIGLEKKICNGLGFSCGLLKRFGKVEHFVILTGIKVSLF